MVGKNKCLEFSLWMGNSFLVWLLLQSRYYLKHGMYWRLYWNMSISYKSAEILNNIKKCFNMLRQYCYCVSLHEKSNVNWLLNLQIYPQSQSVPENCSCFPYIRQFHNNAQLNKFIYMIVNKRWKVTTWSEMHMLILTKTIVYCSKCWIYLFLFSFISRFSKWFFDNNRQQEGMHI